MKIHLKWINICTFPLVLEYRSEKTITIFSHMTTGLHDLLLLAASETIFL